MYLLADQPTGEEKSPLKAEQESIVLCENTAKKSNDFSLQKKFLRL